MKYLEKLNESLRVLLAASGTVLRDAWRMQKLALVWMVILSALVALLPYAASGVNALLIGELVHNYNTKVFSETLIVLVIAAILAQFAERAAQLVSQIIDRFVWIRTQQSYDIKLSDKLATLDPATHESPEFKDKLHLIEEYNAPIYSANLLESSIKNIQNLISFVFAASVVLIIDWRLSFLMIIASVPSLYAELKYGRSMWAVYMTNSSARRLYFELKRHTQTSTNIQELQALQAVPYFVQRLRQMLGSFFSDQLREERKKFMMLIGVELIRIITVAIVIVMLTSKVVHGEIKIPVYIFATTTAIGLQSAISAFFLDLAGQIRDARPVNAFFEILKQERTIKNSVNGATVRKDRAPRIEFRNVSFSYPGKSEQVLKNFSLTVETGERIALVGVNGAGKSTLIKLLCRFYDPTEGAVYVDGVNLREIDLDSWHSTLAVLYQEFQVHRLETDELIGLGRHDAPRELCDVQRAARRSEAASFIEQWELQYKQQIGTEFGGVDPSGGQRQKLALARTFYRDALVSVLDEPTSNIDAAAEQEIFERLETELRPNQSLILISHRFSTVRKANRICVIKDGTVAELGSHDELIALDGIYADLFEKQADGYR